METGIIAGKVSSDRWFLVPFSGDNDGKVSVESTKIARMAFFRIVDNRDSFMTNSDDVVRQVISFIRDGRFVKKERADRQD